MILIMSDHTALFATPDRQLSLGTGEFLFHRGAQVTDLFLVTAGAVQLVRHQADGRLLVQQRAGPGQIVAEASLFSARYHCDAIATSPTCIHAVDRTRLRRELERDRTLALAWLESLALDVQRARLRSEILTLRTVGQRLDAWLEVAGPPRRGQWKSLAEQIGVSPEALYRELSQRRRRPR